MKTIPQAPATRRDNVVEEMHGQQIIDPYRWLEEARSPDTVAWTQAQNAYTSSLLEATPERAKIAEEVRELLAVGSISAPVEREGRFFYLRREGYQNQAVLYVRDGVDGPDRVLLDPNRESSDGVVTLDWWYPSRDGGLVAYGYSLNGDEWSTLHIVSVEDGVVLPDRIARARNAAVAWLPDSSAFYYTRYPTPGQVPPGEESYHKRLFLHSLGADPAADEEIVVTQLEPEDMVSASTSRDGRYLVATVFRGWERSDLYVRDLSVVGSAFTPVAVGHDALFAAWAIEDKLYVHTNLDAPRYRLFQVDARNPSPDGWQEIIPESSDAVLEAVAFAAGRIAAVYLRNAVSSLSILDISGSRLFDVDLPMLGTLVEVRGEWTGRDLFYNFQSFTVPPTIYRLDLERGEAELWQTISANLQADDYLVTQEWYTSRDGTRGSMFVVRRKDIQPNGAHPTLLTGYGGFNISSTPVFMRSAYLWLRRGGIYVLANLRGGGEYGEEWHRAGMLQHKQNVFDDFIAAAEHLISAGYTDAEHLGIMGGSNGGLLVGAALTQRPELFRAVVCQVPLLDMLRYHRFLIARLWIPEYGSADNPEQFEYIHAYSPYHHVQDGTVYPAVLLATAESDSRVDPMHARKMTARLQAASHSERPILLRVETQAGHGIGKPLNKVIEAQTDVWSFLFWQLGMAA